MTKNRWYAIHVLSQYENKVKNYIDKVKKERGFDEKINEVIIPMDTEVKRVQGKKVEKKTKVFPGYVLINMKMDDESFNFIKRVPGVTNFVSSSQKKPVALKDSEVKEILESLNPDKGFIPKKKFEKDMIVRIVEGPFTEFSGKIETVFEEKEMLRIMISIFGRKDLNTGILLNLTNGGEGFSGFKHSDEYKKNVSIRMKKWMSLHFSPTYDKFLLLNVSGENYIVNDGLAPFCKEKNIPFEGMKRRKNRGFDTPTKCGWYYFNITDKTEEEIQNIKKQFFLKYQNRFNTKLKNLEIPSNIEIAQKSINITFNIIEEKIENEYDRLINYNGKKYIKISEDEFKQHKISSKTVYKAIQILKQNGIISVEKINKSNFDQSNYYSL